MYSFWVRLNQVVFFCLGVLGALCVLATISIHFLPPPSPEVSQLKVNELKRLAFFRGADRALLLYDLEFDLRSLFNWNVKQLFVFLVAEYKSSSNKINQVVVYDTIIQNKEAAKRTLTAELNKYLLTDEKDELRNAKVAFKLFWDVMPYFGFMNLQSRGEYNFSMPAEYIK